MTLSRLARLAGALQIVAAAALLLFPIIVIVALLRPDLFELSLTLPTDLPPGDWPLTSWIGALAMLVPLTFMMLALWGMFRLFGLYRTSEPLSPRTGPLIQSIGRNMMIAAAMGIAVDPIQTGLMSMTNPPGERFISISFDSGDVGFLLVAGLLTLIGWSMSEAQRLAEENRGFI